MHIIYREHVLKYCDVFAIYLTLSLIQFIKHRGKAGYQPQWMYLTWHVYGIVP